MYDRIVVALDGSQLAEQVLPHAEALGQRFQSTLVLVRATAAPDVLAPTAAALGGPVVDPLPIIEAEVREAVAYLEAVATRLRKQGLAVECEQRDGAPATVILDVARRRGADLIALTTHGRGGLLRLVFGSVAEEVLRKASCQVLLVRASEEDGKQAEPGSQAEESPGHRSRDVSER